MPPDKKLVAVAAIRYTHTRVRPAATPSFFIFQAVIWARPRMQNFHFAKLDSLYEIPFRRASRGDNEWRGRKSERESERKWITIIFIRAAGPDSVFTCGCLRLALLGRLYLAIYPNKLRNGYWLIKGRGPRFFRAISRSSVVRCWGWGDTVFVIADYQ